MRLTRLGADKFRNLAPFDLAGPPQFVVFHGANAQGKTNVLEAIWFVANLRPLRGRRRDLVRWGQAEATVSARVEHQNIERAYRVELGPSGRKAKLDGKVAQQSEYFRGVRAIAFTPADGAIVSGEPARRRAWIDRAAFTRSPVHLELVRTVRRLLDQKSATLRADRLDVALLDVLDTQLAAEGGRLVQRRKEMLAELQPHVQAVHDKLSGGGALELRYRGGDGELAEQLARARPGELRRRRTLVGPQVHDVVVLIDGKPARTFGSRGQIRTAVLSLKLAEMVAARQRGEVPIFLLDDVSSELDRTRTGQLVEALGDLGAQVFATTTDPSHIDRLPASESLRVKVHNGELEPD